MKYEPILLDIETQLDFFNPEGCCFSSQAADVSRQILRLFDWARTNNVHVISTVLRVRSGEQGPLMKEPHCIEGTEGEQKLPGTVMSSRLNLGLRNTTDLPVDLFEGHQQVIIEKRDTDIFAHARAERMITEIDAQTYIICGAGIARGIVQAAVGLRSRGYGVVLATDAVLGLGDPLTEMAMLRMEAKGVIMAKTDEIVAPKVSRKLTPFRKSVPATEQQTK